MKNLVATSGVVDAIKRNWLMLHGQIGDLSHISSDRRTAYVTMKLLARFPILRRRASGTSQGTLVASAESQVIGDQAIIAEDVRTNGISLGLKLAENTCDAIRRYADAKPFYVDGPTGTEARRLNDACAAGVRFGVYYNASSRLEAIRRLRQDPVLVEAATAYLGTQPKFIGATLWWCFAGKRSEWLDSTYSSHWHYDIDDYRSIKFFFYLSDVEKDDGAHCYLTSTHKDRPLLVNIMARRFSDQEVRSAFPDAAEVIVTGPAGTGFAIDNFGLHRGLPCTGRNRLALEICFGISAFDQLSDLRKELLV